MKLNPERWAEAEEILHGVLDRAEHEREAYLDTTCTDPTVRQLVNELVAAHAASGPVDRLARSLGSTRAESEARVDDTVSLLSSAIADRYRIEHELGRGGTATVYLAHDLRHDRRVALKVLRSELTHALGAERFLHEVAVTARLEHPYILPLFDSGEVGGFLYYVMPCVEGESLRDRLLREGRLPLTDALQIAREVADALSYAHAQGVLHRDIKPQNILLAGGHARVADFGIARALTTASRLSAAEAGLAVGTPVYMSPEQARGEPDLDVRTDLYSLGCVLYEMLAGVPPFSGPTPREVLGRKGTEPVPARGWERGAVPESVEVVIMGALARAREDRYATAAELARSLDDAAAPKAVAGPAWRPLVGSKTGAALLLLLLVSFGATGAALVRSAWTRSTADTVLAMQRMMDRKDFVSAYRLTQNAEPTLAVNPEFQRLLRASTFPMSIRTTPAGARVFINDYLTPDDDWILLGVSPVEEARIPASYLRLRIELDGFRTHEGTLHGYYASAVAFELQPEGARTDMLPVPPARFQFWSAPPAQLAPYALDVHEVSNREFKDFVDRGGYREQHLWPQPILAEARAIPWVQAVGAFTDRTGRPGPADWEYGNFPADAGDHPVGGVSWYEAAAYCAYAGKRLPTFYHWYNAAGLTAFSHILKLSNLEKEQVAPVGTHSGIGPYGHYDMAGNVREWALNPIGDRRYILGGAWSDPGYMFFHPDAISPGDRSTKNGFRCAVYDEAAAEAQGGALDAVAHQYEREPVDDEVFRLYRNLYDYEPSALNARIDSVDERSPLWRRETISFDAPYGDERIVAHLFLPRTGTPPYQAVVYYPGVDAFRLESSTDMHTWWFDFIVRSGRAVVHPVYEGTYERRPGSALYRERMIHWAMDIRRTLDYLETRSDIDAGMLAYYGFSAGAWRGPVFTAVEPRFRASVLLAGGLYWQRLDPEIEPTNFAPRAVTPVLLVGGRDDFFFPVDVSQVPLLRLLGAPEQDKHHVVIEGGHVPDRWEDVVREVLGWLDRYLEPVR